MAQEPAPPAPDSGSLPDDGDELGHGELVRHQELGLVQRGEELLALIALDDHLRGESDR